MSLYVDIFVWVFVWEFLQRMFYLYNMYHVQCVHFYGIQGSMICVVDRNQVLCDVTFSDHIVHPWWMDFNCSIDILFLYITFHRQFNTDIDDIVYYIFLNISVIVNFNFHSLYML